MNETEQKFATQLHSLVQEAMLSNDVSAIHIIGSLDISKALAMNILLQAASEEFEKASQGEVKH